MPTGSYTINLNTLLVLINNYNQNNGTCPIAGCTNPGLTWLDQNSPEHLRFIPVCLDHDSTLNRGYNLIQKTSKKLPHELERNLKRETFLEFKDQKTKSLSLILVTSNINIVNLARKNNNFNVINSGNPKYYHLKQTPIYNLQKDFNKDVTLFLNLLGLLYP